LSYGGKQKKRRSILDRRFSIVDEDGGCVTAAIMGVELRPAPRWPG
jgi:hypothetical protein